jgi:hypothetical protein
MSVALVLLAVLLSPILLLAIALSFPPNVPSTLKVRRTRCFRCALLLCARLHTEDHQRNPACRMGLMYRLPSLRSIKLIHS